MSWRVRFLPRVYSEKFAAKKENKQSFYAEDLFKQKNLTRINSVCRGSYYLTMKLNEKKEIKTKVALWGLGLLPLFTS